MSLKHILLFSSGGHFVMWDQTFCPYLAEGIMPNTSLKLFKEFGSLVKKFRFLV